jgi:SAM-dependent methyltransferase
VTDSNGTPGEAGAIRELDDLVSELRARVEARRASGFYPEGLEEEMTEHFQRILTQRRSPRRLPDIRRAVQESGRALPLAAERIGDDSGMPGGQLVHKAVARLVGRQTQGIIEQVQRFAQPVQEALDALVGAIDDLAADVAQSLDSLYERQAAQERTMMAAGYGDRRAARAAGFKPWYSSERFEQAFRGSREEMFERYRDLASRLVGAGPVLDLGCGRGEFLELLVECGVDAYGVDTDEELVKSGINRGLRIQEDDGLRHLAELEDRALGGLVLIQVIEHFSPQEMVDFVALAADKLRPGGRLLIETVNPQSIYVFAHAVYLDPAQVRPVHPAYLAFVLREAGFASVDIEWRSPPPTSDILEPVPGDTPGASLHNENVRRLNELLFAPQDYLIAASR